MDPVRRCDRREPAADRAAGSRPQSFEEIAARHAREIVLFLRRHTGDHHDAEDLAQDVFVRAWRSFGTLRDAAAARTWLYQIALNRFSDFVRSRRRSADRLRQVAAPEAEGEAGPGTRPDKATMARELDARLREAILALPARQRDVILLVTARGFGYPEIAAMLGISVDAVKMSLFHAREKLRAGFAGWLRS